MDGFKRDDLSKMPMIGSDLLESSQLKVSFTDSYLEQRRAYSDPKRGLRNVIQLIRWRRTKTIGSGGFGITYIQEDDRGERRAVKETPKSLGRKEIIKVWREIMAMASFTKDEALFVKFDGWFQNDTHLHIAMEFVELGDLQNYLDRAMPENQAQDVAFQLNEAVHSMHSKGFVHQDIEPAHVLVASRSPSWWVKLKITERVQGGPFELHNCFDNSFDAPETLGLLVDATAERYSKAADSWSLGCLAYWLMTLEDAVPRETFAAIHSGQQPLPPIKLSATDASVNAIDYITSLVKVDPKMRLTVSEALDHPWIQQAPLKTNQSSPDIVLTSLLNTETSLQMLDKPVSLPPFPTVEDVSDEEFGKALEPPWPGLIAVRSLVEEEFDASNRQARKINDCVQNELQQQSGATGIAPKELLQNSSQTADDKHLGPEHGRDITTTGHVASNLSGKGSIQSSGQFSANGPEDCPASKGDPPRKPFRSGNPRNAIEQVTEASDLRAGGNSFSSLANSPQFMQKDHRPNTYHGPGQPKSAMALKKGSWEGKGSADCPALRQSWEKRHSSDTELYDKPNDEVHNSNHFVKGNSSTDYGQKEGTQSNDLNPAQADSSSKQAQTSRNGRRFLPSNPEAIFNRFLSDERLKSEEIDIEFLDAFGVSVFEKPLPLSVEELYSGCHKNIKILRTLHDSATDSTELRDTIVEIDVKPGQPIGSKIRSLDTRSRTEQNRQQDIYFVVAQKAHSRFTVDGADLKTTVQISIREAMTGWSRLLDSIDGKIVRIRGTIPTRDGHVEAYAGLGMPRSDKPDERGDMLVQFNVKALEEMA